MARRKPVVNGRMTTVQVAVKLRIKYQRARNLMMSGALGDVEYDDQQHMTVSEAAVNEYKVKTAKPQP